MLDALAGRFSFSPRSPVLRSPADQGLDFEDVTFPAEDGTPLEGWFVPADRAGAGVVIVNHPRFFSRSGMSSRLEPWRSMNAATGNDLAVLHAVGHHVLAYDLRNFGRSGAADGVVTSSGRLESHSPLGRLPALSAVPRAGSWTGSPGTGADPHLLTGRVAPTTTPFTRASQLPQRQRT